MHQSNEQIEQQRDALWEDPHYITNRTGDYEVTILTWFGAEKEKTDQRVPHTFRCGQCLLTSNRKLEKTADVIFFNHEPNIALDSV